MKKEQLDDILERLLSARESNISDINITPDCPFQVEFEGSLTAVETDPGLHSQNKLLSSFQTASIVCLLIGKQERCWQSLKETGSCDLAYQLRKTARFRVNIFTRRGSYSIVLRKLETEIPSLSDLNCPEIFRKVISEKTGLILVTGATGSGKSTTLAAMLRHLNESQAIHIVTLEDPIEFVHPNMQATFNQRELGDFDTFPNALRAALRQAPKVILVGEMRDRQTLEIGLKAAETGHLVISTLHTVDAGQTINRIVGMFDKDEEEQIRIRLSETLRWVICQRLLKKEGGGRVACHEIMGSNLRTVELIQQGEDETKTYFSVISASEALGWKTFEASF